MDCASCLRKIEDRLRTVDGVTEVRGSPVARTLTVEGDASRLDPETIRREVGRLGYLARSLDGDDTRVERPVIWKGRGALIAYGSMALFAVGLVLRALGIAPPLFALPLHDVALPDLFFLASALVGGWNFFPKGLRAARALSLDMNFLMTVAIVGAVGIGEYMEGAAIAFLFALAELLENYSVERARASVESLMDLAPDTARVLREGREMRIPAEELVVGDQVLLRPGDRVPADGIAEEGRSAVNQAPITGESMPVGKEPGDPLFAGTINQGGFLRMRVERPASESSLSRIIHLVEEAESSRTRSERFVERFARIYTPAVTIAAVAVVFIPPLLLGAPFLTWFVRGLTLLVIACPCALVISTPVAVVSGITAAARNGVLIKGGTFLEAMGQVKVLALDKTGTLTVGHPRVVGIHGVDGIGEEEVLARAAAVEARSEHPIARAILDEAEAREVAVPWQVTDFEGEVGRGARARLDGVEYAVGSAAFLAGGAATNGAEADRGPAAAVGTTPAHQELPESLRDGTGAFVGLAREGRLLAWISLADPPRPRAAEAMEALRSAGLRHVVLLSGDRTETAEAVGRAIGVDEVRAGLLPEEKVDAVKDLERRFGPVAMVGDGVNDAPALAAATVGIAMGAAGSHTALETADIALMGDDLTRLPYLYRLSHSAGGVIRQNIGAAILVKALLAIGVPLGLVSLIAAVIVGDMGVSLAVTLNALRLGRMKPAAAAPREISASSLPRPEPVH